MKSDSKEGKIERLKKSLYRQKQISSQKKRFALHEHNMESKSAWETPEDEPPEEPSAPPMLFWKKFFIVSVLFFIFAVLVASFILLRDSNVVSTKNVDILIFGPVSTPAGEEVQLQVIIENNNVVPLEFVDLLIEYPEGTRGTEDLRRDVMRFRKSLGRIGSGEVLKEPVRLVLFGQEGDEKEFHITLEYRVEDSNAIFIKEKKYIMRISSSATSLSFGTPSEVVAGQEFEMRVSVVSNADIVTRDLLVNIEYPFGFSFISADPKPVGDDDTWIIGDLAPQARRVIVIRGVLEGQDGEEKVFRISSGTRSEERQNELGIVYNTSLTEISIARPFLSVLLFINGETGTPHIVESRELIDVDIIWTNNLLTKIVDAKIKAELSGGTINKLSVRPRGGFYNSANNTIIWDKNSLLELANIESGSQGQANFQFTLQPLFTTSGSLFKNPTIDIKITTSGRRLSERGVQEEIKNSVEQTIKITSDVVFTPRIVYFVGPLQNSGPIPPEVDGVTTYTVIWAAVNSSNHVSRAIVKAILPPYVSWTDTKIPVGENISFNESSREITWNLGRLEAGTGITMPPREVAFQVRFVPSLSHLNQTPTIVGQSTFSGVDEFTEAVIRFSGRALDTSLNTDPNFIFSQAKVILHKDEIE